MTSAKPHLVNISSNDLFEQLADNFTDQLRAGLHPDVDEFAQQNPELATRIRTLFPMLVAMETGAGEPESIDPPLLAKNPIDDIQRLGDFRILREIGRGGMGVVYEAIQESLERTVALKVLPHATMDSRAIERFSQEARLAAMLHHTNIVPVYGTGQQQGYSYFVMQYIEGESLDRVLIDLKQLRDSDSGNKSNKPANRKTDDSRSTNIAVNLSTAEVSAEDFPGKLAKSGDTTKVSESAAMIETKTSHSSDHSFSETGNRFWYNVAQVGLQVAAGLTHAHSQGILHRDIKPSNLILDETGSLWITDFGLAKLHQSVNLTRTGEVVGTLRYMPPEHFSGESDQRSDIYGLGLTLYEMATLAPAFPSSDHRRLMAEVIECKPLAPRKINPRIPRDLETIILKAISFEPAKRYQSAAELGRDLKRFLEGQPIKARPIGAAERFVKWSKRHPAIASLSALLLLFTGLGVAGITWKWREADANYRESLKQSEAREKYFSRALDAVDQMLARVGTDKLAHVPRMSHIRKELLHDALEFYQVFLNESDNDPSLRAEIAKVQRRAGDIQAMLGDKSEAITSFEESRIIFTQLHKEFPENTDYIKELATVKANLSSVLMVLGSGQQSEKEAEEAFQLLAKGLVDFEQQMTELERIDWEGLIANAQYHLGSVQVTTQGNSVAIPRLLHAKELFEELPSEVLGERLRMKYAQCIRSLGQLLDGEGQIEEAAVLGQQAVKEFQSLAKDFPDVPHYKNSLADSQQYLSGVLARQGKFQDAIKEIESEIQLRTSITQQYPDLPDFQSDLSRSYAIYGGMLHQIGNEERAESILLKSIEISEKLLQQYPENIGYLIEAGYATQVMGANLTLTRRKDKEEEAIAYSQRSYELRKKIVQIRPKDRACLMDLATTARNYCAILLNTDGDAKQIMDLGQEAVDICLAAIETDPDNADTLYQLAYNQIGLSRLLTQLETGDPLPPLQSGIKSLNELIQIQPDEPRHRLQLTRAYDQLANLQFRSEAWDDWEDTLRQGNENMEASVQQFGADTRLVQFLTISKNRLGHCLKTRGHVEQALKLFQEALVYRQQVLDRDPNNDRGKREAASAHRNLAWVYAYFLDQPNLELAREHALKAVEFDADTSDHWTALAYVYLQLDNTAKMRQALNAVETEKPTEIMARLAIKSLAANQAQKAAEAQQYLSQAQQLSQSDEVRQNYEARWLKPELFAIVLEAQESIGNP